MPFAPPPQLLAYYRAGKPLACEIEQEPYLCEFWPMQELETWNAEYEVPAYAPGFFGFATNGGGEMFALSPTGSVVYLPFIGMEPSLARELAPTWTDFEGSLRNAL